MPKDRDITFPIVWGEVEILYQRSSARPVEYAIMLRVNGPEGWQTVISADNAHRDLHVDEHHFHRYSGGTRQKAEPLPFPAADTNDAMNKIIRWFADDWEKIR